MATHRVACFGGSWHRQEMSLGNASLHKTITVLPCGEKTAKTCNVREVYERSLGDSTYFFVERYEVKKMAHRKAHL